LADAGDGSLLKSEMVPLVGLEATWLEQLARRAGASAVGCFGDYQGQSYDRIGSVDLVIVARR